MSPSRDIARRHVIDLGQWYASAQTGEIKWDYFGLALSPPIEIYIR